MARLGLSSHLGTVGNSRTAPGVRDTLTRPGQAAATQKRVGGHSALTTSAPPYPVATGAVATPTSESASVTRVVTEALSQY